MLLANKLTVPFTSTVVPLSTSFFTSVNVNANTITIPATAVAGDLAIYFDGAASTGGTQTTGLLSGWTQVGLNSGGILSSVISYKVLAAGEPGTTVNSPSTGSSSGRDMIFILRPTIPITSVTFGQFNGQHTTGVPTNQVVNGTTVSNGAGSLFMFGQYRGSAAVTTRGSSVTMTEVQGSSTVHFVKYKIYNQTSGESITFSQSDDGEQILQSAYILIN